MIEHPFLKPLVVVLKKYFSLKNLNNSFMGTGSSYGLVLMILALIDDIRRTEP
jgi:DNA polymerase sigma